MGYALYSGFQVHPGVWVQREIVEAYGLSVAQCAGRLHMEAAMLSALLAGQHALCPTIALRLQNAFGIRAATLLAMQAEYDRLQQQQDLPSQWKRSRRRPGSSPG